MEIARRGFTAWSDGNATVLIQGLDPDVVLHVHQAGQGVYRGRKGAMESLVDWTGDFDDFKVFPEEFLEKDDYVVVRVRQTGIGKSSRAPIEGLAWFVCQMSEGRAVRVDVFVDEQAALEAAGLSE